MSRTRRNFNSAFKAKVAIEAIKEQRTISELAQEFEIHPNQVSQWKREFLERSAQIFEGDKKQAEELAILEQNHRLAQQHIGRAERLSMASLTMISKETQIVDICNNSLTFCLLRI